MGEIKYRLEVQVRAYEPGGHRWCQMAEFDSEKDAREAMDFHRKEGGYFRVIKVEVVADVYDPGTPGKAVNEDGIDIIG